MTLTRGTPVYIYIYIYIYIYMCVCVCVCVCFIFILFLRWYCIIYAFHHFALHFLAFNDSLKRKYTSKNVLFKHLCFILLWGCTENFRRNGRCNAGPYCINVGSFVTLSVFSQKVFFLGGGMLYKTRNPCQIVCSALNCNTELKIRTKRQLKGDLPLIAKCFCS